jgi:cobalt-zinc-cadmium efflux system membrane fusion protein
MNRLVPHNLILLGVLLICASACGKAQEPVSTDAKLRPSTEEVSQSRTEKSRIETAVVTFGQSQPELILSGKIAYGEDRYSKVSSPVQGRVLEVRARLGDHVKAGDVLLAIDSPDISAAYSSFVKEASDMEFAQRGYELAKDLYETKALPQKDLKMAENDLIKARAAFRNAKERLLTLKVPTAELEKPLAQQMITSHFNLKSPMTGTVVERTITPGQSVNGDTNQVLFTVAELDKVQVVADVYERDLRLVKVGASISVSVEAYPGEVFSASIATIGDVVDPVSRTIKVRAWIDNKDGRLKPEMFARLRIQIGEQKSSISVPREAVLEIEGKEYVYVVPSGGTYEKRLVKVGSSSEESLQIVDGLSQGERVVVKGVILIRGQETKG